MRHLPCRQQRGYGPAERRKDGCVDIFPVGSREAMDQQNLARTVAWQPLQCLSRLSPADRSHLKKACAVRLTELAPWPMSALSSHPPTMSINATERGCGRGKKKRRAAARKAGSADEGGPACGGCAGVRRRPLRRVRFQTGLVTAWRRPGAATRAFEHSTRFETALE